MDAVDRAVVLELAPVQVGGQREGGNTPVEGAVDDLELDGYPARVWSATTWSSTWRAPFARRPSEAR
ncbi:hypothetical protein [Saccharopolyspora hordei]|uniref:Uncharacterized protein n=1 Tax=Saccharopolyspora hordei TaxID=1838 RepID=A0A853AS25_9PSEU|nr:hypothetical protein [Saccharopolyspora hordei]